MKVATRTYALSIEKHPDGYLAHFPALPGCNTWGKTYEDAINYAKEALALYLETLLVRGDDIPEDTGIPKPVSLSVTVRTPIAKYFSR